jgi:hypothetical protein
MAWVEFVSCYLRQIDDALVEELFGRVQGLLVRIFAFVLGGEEREGWRRQVKGLVGESLTCVCMSSGFGLPVR